MIHIYSLVFHLSFILFAKEQLSLVEFGKKLRIKKVGDMCNEDPKINCCLFIFYYINSYKISS